MEFLRLTKKLSDKTYERIFIRNQKNEAEIYTYNCVLCCVENLSDETALQVHIKGAHHKHNINNKFIPNADIFRKQLIAYGGSKLIVNFSNLNLIA